MPRPTFLVRVMALGLISLLATMTLTAALVADSVRQMTGGGRTVARFGVSV